MWHKSGQTTLRRRIAERAPETIEELKEAANECWASFTMEGVNNLEKMKDFWRETKCVICNYPNIHIQIFHYGIAAEACVVQ